MRTNERPCQGSEQKKEKKKVQIRLVPVTGRTASSHQLDESSASRLGAAYVSARLRSAAARLQGVDTKPTAADVIGITSARLLWEWKEGITIPPPVKPASLSPTMPPRLRLVAPHLGATRPSPAARCWYSAAATSPSSSEPLIRVTNVPAPHTGHIRVLELNRPAARNAISKALLFTLRGEIDEVHAQYDAATGEELATQSWNKRFGGVAGESEIGPTRAVVLASAVDSCFCAGADLKERKGFTQEEYVVLPVPFRMDW